MKTQRDNLALMMLDGWVTPLDALKQHLILRFSARINEIKKLVEVEEIWMRVGKDGTKRVKAFRIKGARV